nr:MULTISPECIES: shikimate kinase [unclassified Clostridium]
MIGMPSSGKSTIGVLLAKRLGFSFVDVDIVIQEKEGKLLKEIIAEEGMDGFLKVEERINAGLDVALSVIAPGGSVIYGEKAMEHLKEISEVVYLKMSYEEMEKRIGNVVDRGVALKPGFTLRDLYNERVPYYEKYADITIDEEGKTPGDTVDALRDIIEGMMDRNMIERIVEEQKKILEEKDRRIEAYEAEIAALKEELALLRSAGTV